MLKNYYYPNTTTQLLRYQIKQIGIEPEMFDSLMIQNGCLIAGDFVLQAEVTRIQLSWKWSASTIDIFVPYSVRLKKFHRFFNTSGYVLQETTLTSDKISSIKYPELYDNIFEIQIFCLDHQQNQPCKLYIYRLKQSVDVKTAITSINPIKLEHFVYDGKSVSSYDKLEISDAYQKVKITLDDDQIVNKSTTFELILVLKNVVKFIKIGFVLLDNSLSNLISIFFHKLLDDLQDNNENNTSHESRFTTHMVHERMNLIQTFVVECLKILREIDVHMKHKLFIQFNIKTMCVEIGSKNSQRNFIITHIINFTNAIRGGSIPQQIQALENTGVYDIPQALLYPIPEPQITSSQTFEQMLVGGLCFNIVDYDYRKVFEYINEPEQQNLYDNIVFIDKRTHKAVCFTKSQIEHSLQDYSSIYLPCVGKNNGFPVATNIMLIKIFSPSGEPVYVPYEDITNLLYNPKFANIQIFKLIESYVTINYTASADAVIQKNFVSSHHCQVGTNKRVHRLLPIMIMSE